MQRAPELRWSPDEEISAIDEAGRLTESLDLLHCPIGGSCRKLGTAAAGERNEHLEQSSSSRFAFRVGAARKGVFLDTFPLEAGAARLDRCKLDDTFMYRRSASSIDAVAGDHLLIWWGAGTGVAFADLYDHRCKTVLDLGAPNFELSPSRKYLAEYPDSEGGQEPGFVTSVRVYDLAIAGLSATVETTGPLGDLGWIGDKLCVVNHLGEIKLVDFD